MMREWTGSRPAEKKRFPLYRWDYELAKSPWAIALALESAVLSSLGIIATTVVFFGTKVVNTENAPYLLALAAGFGLFGWVASLINGGSWFNFVEFQDDVLRIASQSRYGDLKLKKDDIAAITSLPRPKVPRWLLPLVVCGPFSQSSCWIVPPSGGFRLTLSQPRFTALPFPWWRREIDLGPRDRQGFENYFRIWKEPKADRVDWSDLADGGP